MFTNTTEAEAVMLPPTEAPDENVLLPGVHNEAWKKAYLECNFCSTEDAFDEYLRGRDANPVRRASPRARIYTTCRKCLPQTSYD